MHPLAKLLWSHVADLAFDCFYLANVTTDRSRRRLLTRLKDSAEFLSQSAGQGLRWRRPGGASCLLQIQFLIGDLQRQLLLASGLGALSAIHYEKLSARASALAHAFNHPRVNALFRWEEENR